MAPTPTRTTPLLAALSLAALNGNLPLVQLLLAKGADPNPRSLSPLAAACYHRHTDVAKCLFAHGATPPFSNDRPPEKLMTRKSRHDFFKETNMVRVVSDDSVHSGYFPRYLTHDSRTVSCDECSL